MNPGTGIVRHVIEMYDSLHLEKSAGSLGDDGPTARRVGGRRDEVRAERREAGIKSDYQAIMAVLPDRMETDTLLVRLGTAAWIPWET